VDRVQSGPQFGRAHETGWGSYDTGAYFPGGTGRSEAHVSHPSGPTSPRNCSGPRDTNTGGSKPVLKKKLPAQVQYGVYVSGTETGNGLLCPNSALELTDILCRQYERTVWQQQTVCTLTTHILQINPLTSIALTM